jgi:tetratricopeptide (TPR) repeat protein
MRKLILAIVLFSATLAVQAQKKEDKELAKRAKEAYKAAEDAFKKKDFKATIDQVDKSFESEKYKTDPKAWILRGNSYAELAIADSASKEDAVVEGNMAKMDESFNKAIELDKKQEVLLVEPKRREVYGRMLNFGVNAYNSSDIPAAARGFRRAHLATPLDTIALIYSLAAESALEDEKDYKKIEYYSRKLIDLAPAKDVSPYSALLDKYMNKDENMEEAMKILAMGRKYFPNDKYLQGQQINIYLKTNKIAEAVADLEKAKASETDPKQKFIYLINLGILYEQDKKLDQAEKSYKEALAIDPKNDEAIYSLGAFYYNKAVNIKKEADNMNIDEYKTKGQPILDKAKVQFNEALPYFKTAVDNKPTNLERLNALRTIYIITEKASEAMPAYVRALKMEPDNADILEGLVLVAEAANQPAQAAPYIEERVRKKPSDPELLNMLLRVYQKIGKEKVKDARPYFENAAKLEPNNIEILEGLSLIYYTIGMKKEADELEKKIEKLNKK